MDELEALEKEIETWFGYAREQMIESSNADDVPLYREWMGMCKAYEYVLEEIYKLQEMNNQEK